MLKYLSGSTYFIFSDLYIIKPQKFQKHLDILDSNYIVINSPTLLDH